MKARAGTDWPSAAAAEGLLDVAYATADSPFGPLLLASDPRGLVRVGLPNQDADELLAELASGSRRGCWRRPRGSTRCAASSTSTSRASSTDFDLPLDWRLSEGFRRKVLRADRPHPLRADPQLQRDGARAPATSAPSAPPAPPAARTRSRSSSPATGCCAPAAASAATAAGCR